MKKFAVGLTVAVLAVLVVVSSPVYAQDTYPPDRPGRMGGSGRAGAGTAGARMAGTGLQNLDAATVDLGMTVEELQAAIAGGTTLHDLYLEAGLDLPEWMQEVLYLYDYGTDRQAYLADLLGMTVEELQAAMADGTTAHELAAAAGIELPLPDAGQMGGHGAGAATMNGGMSAGSGTMADALGLTIEELEAQIAAGNTLQDLFEAAGMDFPNGGFGARGGRTGR